MSNDLQKLAREKAEQWLAGPYDSATKNEVKRLIEGDEKAFFDAFYKDLEFGTGGLRGVMGAGSNRMNLYTVGAATQGLAAYLLECFPDQPIKVAVGHDSRHHSREFAERVADVMASNGIEVYLFDELRPTPELSFAIRQLGCQSGVMITASHNPKQYNGYKAYWTDGSQVTEPHDARIIEHVGRVTDPSQVRVGQAGDRLHVLGRDFDEKYLARIKELSLYTPQSPLKIVYSPMHGAGVRLVPESLKRFGFSDIVMVEQQAVLDGDFPTVASPNPEERATMRMALELGAKEKADIVLATDPDSDRLAVAVPDENGEFYLLNGNQTLCLLMSYQLTRLAELGRIGAKDYVVKTIVTSTMPNAVAERFGVRCYDCLTGFKYIAKIIRERPDEHYIGGGEESFGYLAGDYVRDKDGVSACSLAAEAAAWARETLGLSLLGWLKQLYVQYGFYLEGLHSIVRPGKEGSDEIRAMMVDYRQTPPRSIAGSAVVRVDDFQSLSSLDAVSGIATPLVQERSNVLRWHTADGTVVSVRPSGTEPKIKFYFGVRAELPTVAEFDRVEAALAGKIETIKKELKL